ncbi:MAG: apolipoprotein N-acyltransferase [Gammaproteobacteria bacterium]|nr:apolipoprotein N-acyltransferase [Gammaproteobacteria bacterium]
MIRARFEDFVARRGGWMAAGAGLALPLAFAPFDLYPLAMLCVAVLFLAWEGAAPRTAAWRGFLFGSGAFLTGTYWIYISVRIIAGVPLYVALPLLLGLVAIMGLYFALLGYASARWLQCAPALRWLLALPAAWVLIEWLRGWVLSGFPWLSLGYSQVDSWLGGIAPVLGVYGVTWAVAASAGSLVALLKSSTPVRAGALSLLAVLWLAAGALGAVRWTQPVGEPLRASLLQGSIAQKIKWEPEQLAPTLELYRAMTEAHWDSDLIIWPEAAVPALAHHVDAYLRNLHAEAQRRGAAILLGIPVYEPETQQYRNSVLVMGETLQIYSKRHLVPFGEYFPVPPFARNWMRRHDLPYTDQTPGAPDPDPYLAAGEKLALTICYEDAYGAEQLSYLPEATLLVNVSNDAWFGDSIAPHQHLQIARMRALEAGRYQLRATNTGVSAIIGPDGRVVQASPQFTTDVLTSNVQPYKGRTPYMAVGNWAVIIMALVALAIGKWGHAWCRHAAFRWTRKSGMSPFSPAPSEK